MLEYLCFFDYSTSDNACYFIVKSAQLGQSMRPLYIPSKHLLEELPCLLFLFCSLILNFLPW